MNAKRKILEKIVRVDQAGEVGAQQIYEGQKLVFKTLKNKKDFDQISRMADEEKEHLDYFNELAKKGMAITESSDHLQCRYDARHDILGPFAQKMTRLQRYYHEVSLDILKKRIQVWKDFESNSINLKKARDMNRSLESSVDKLMQKKVEQLEAAKKDV